MGLFVPLALVVATAGAAETRVNFEITGLLVNAAKPNGAAWDVGGPEVPASRLVQLATLALGGEPVISRVVAELVSVVGGSMAAPDLHVRVELLESGRVIRTDLLPVQDNTFQPTWSGRLHEGLPIGKGLSVRLTVVDIDLREHDAVGVVVFPSEALLAAARRGGVVWTPVVDQTHGAILFAGVTAWVASGGKEPKGAGAAR